MSYSHAIGDDGNEPQSIADDGGEFDRVENFYQSENSGIGNSTGSG